jgi:uncharacterized protein YvpB
MMKKLTIKIENKEQKTCETCLPVCLMVILRSNGVNIKDNEEMKILTEGLKLIKIDYTIGQLIYLCKKFKLKIKLYVDYPIYYKILSKYDYPKNLELVNRKINSPLLKKIVANKPVIVYVDKYYLDGIYHSPHFIVLESLDNNNAIIMDPWDGRKKTISSKRLSKAISSLRNKLKISPKLIEIA